MSLVINSSAQRLARVISVLVAGEQLAARTCLRQARLANMHGPLVRVLNAQARQEREHAALAGALAICAGKDPQGADAAMRELAVLDHRITHDLENGRLAVTLFGMQGGLDQLGAALIAQLAASPHPVARRFAPLTRRVLAQEQGHVMHGEKWFRLLGGSPSHTLEDYREISRRLAHRTGELVADCGQPGQAAWTAISHQLDGWGA